MFLHKKNTITFNIKYLIFFSFLILFLSNCGKEEKKNEDLTFQDLKEKTLSSLEKKDYDKATTYLENLVAQNSERPDISKYKLLLADTYFNIGNMPSAYEMYKNFTQFYPSDEKSEYASYQAIRSKFYQTLKIECDQTETEQTIQLCKKHLNNFNFKQYNTDVEDIERTCKRKLIDKEIYIYNFYLKKGKYKSATNRLKFLRQNYLQEYPEIHPQLLYLETRLAQKQKNNDLINEKIDELTDKYPDSHFTQMAQQLVNKKSFVF